MQEESMSLAELETAFATSSAPLTLFIRLADRWGLDLAERRILLGGVSRETDLDRHGGEVGTLSRDQLERISLLLGIHRGLTLLFADASGARRWSTSANRDQPFGGASPLGHMLRGSVGDLYAVRRYIDAWRGMK